MKLRVLENFAGIGTQRMALEKLGIDHEVVGITEIDKFAIKSYEAIHGSVNNLGDISLVDPNDVPDHDLFTYSFPCQDISVAGKGKGFEKGSGTRSGLLWECEKVIRAKRPKYLLMENVKNLVSKKFKPGFEEWLTALEELGYTNYWQVLNAKDYGIPQNRERVFCVSILGEHEPYEFPEKETLELRLKDILEEVVDEKFYLSEEKTNKLIVNSKGLSVGYIPATNGTQHQSNTIYHTDSVSPSMTASDYKSPIKVTIENEDTEPKSEPSVLIKNNTKQGYVEAVDGDGVDLSFPNSSTRRGRVQKDKSQTLDTSGSKGVVVDNSNIKPINPMKGKTDYGWHFEQQVYDSESITRAVKAGGGSGNIPKVIEPKEEFGRMGRQAVETLNKNDVKYSDTINPFNKKVSSDDGVSPTLTTRPEGFKTAILPISKDLRIRKLTPKECWRLMSISDDDFEKAQEVNSNTQLYKQAGNAIVVDVLEAIFTNMFK